MDTIIIRFHRVVICFNKLFFEVYDSGDKYRMSNSTQYHARVYVSPGTPVVDVMAALRTNVE